MEKWLKRFFVFEVVVIATLIFTYVLGSVNTPVFVKAGSGFANDFAILAFYGILIVLYSLFSKRETALFVLIGALTGFVLMRYILRFTYHIEFFGIMDTNILLQISLGINLVFRIFFQKEVCMKEKRNEILAKTIVRDVRGMTLIEIMVVITIIGIVAGAIGYTVFNYLARAKIKTTKLQLKKIAQVLINYAEDVENNEEGYPSSLEVLTQGKFPLLRKKDLKDAWGQPIIYNYPAQKNPDAQFDLCSKGPDKKEGTDDDICFSQ